MAKNVCYLLVPASFKPVFSDGLLTGITGMGGRAFKRFMERKPEWPPGWWMPGTREHDGKRPVQMLMDEKTDLDNTEGCLEVFSIPWAVGLMHGGDRRKPLRNWKPFDRAFLNWMADVWNPVTNQFERPTSATQLHHWAGAVRVAPVDLDTVQDGH